MCVHFLHALLAWVSVLQHIHTYIWNALYYFWYHRGTKCVERKKNTLNEQTMLLLLHYIALIAHHNIKSALASYFCSILFPSLVKFMVTLQMSIILWPNCCSCRCRCCCCWKWWDFHFLILAQSNSLDASTMCMDLLHCLPHVARLFSKYIKWCARHTVVFYDERQYAVDVKITQLLLHFVGNVGKYLHWSEERTYEYMCNKYRVLCVQCNAHRLVYRIL